MLFIRPFCYAIAAIAIGNLLQKREAFCRAVFVYGVQSLLPGMAELRFQVDPKTIVASSFIRHVRNCGMAFDDVKHFGHESAPSCWGVSVYLTRPGCRPFWSQPFQETVDLFLGHPVRSPQSRVLDPQPRLQVVVVRVLERLPRELLGMRHRCQRPLVTRCACEDVVGRVGPSRWGVAASLDLVNRQREMAALRPA